MTTWLLILTIHNAPADHWPPWFRDRADCVAAMRQAVMSAEVVRASCVRKTT